jgi:hypothetical protein
LSTPPDPRSKSQRLRNRAAGRHGGTEWPRHGPRSGLQGSCRIFKTMAVFEDMQHPMRGILHIGCWRPVLSARRAGTSPWKAHFGVDLGPRSQAPTLTHRQTLRVAEVVPHPPCRAPSPRGGWWAAAGVRASIFYGAPYDSASAAINLLVGKGPETHPKARLTAPAAPKKAV